MIVWKSTLVSAEKRFAESCAALKQANCLLAEQLQLAEEHYQQMREDLRMAVGLKPRQVYVPVPEAAAPAQPKPESPAWARGVNTPRDLKQRAEIELARQFAEREMLETTAALAAPVSAADER